jgi:hypothetical protein
MPGGWMVQDANGRPLVYVYGDERPQGVKSQKLTMDEARRIAVNIAKLVELLASAKSVPRNLERGD